MRRKERRKDERKERKRGGRKEKRSKSMKEKAKIQTNKNIYLEKLKESIDQLELLREFSHFDEHRDTLLRSSSMENLLPLLLGVPSAHSPQRSTACRFLSYRAMPCSRSSLS